MLARRIGGLGDAVEEARHGHVAEQTARELFEDGIADRAQAQRLIEHLQRLIFQFGHACQARTRVRQLQPCVAQRGQVREVAAAGLALQHRVARRRHNGDGAARAGAQQQRQQDR